MNLQLKIILFLLLVPLPFISCQKDDKELIVPPNAKIQAKAGNNQHILLPKNYVLLDGSQSTVIKNKPTTYNWSKIAGPASAEILDPTLAQTRVNNLVKGTYQFELKVTAGDVSSRDTVEVTVYDSAVSPIGNPAESGPWTNLGALPADEFFFNGDVWFNGANFLMGINNYVFAISNKGGVWQYLAKNNWKRIGNFPEKMGMIPVVFSLDNTGYCLGNNHLWQFKAKENQWQQKRDVPQQISDARVAMVIQNKVYLVGGTSNHVMLYDPSTNTYSAKNNFPGSEATTGFVVNDKGYCIEASGKCWQYNPVADAWQQQASLPASITFKKGFSLNEYGYIMGDLNHTAYNHNQPIRVWRFDPKANEWNDFKGDYPGYGVYEIQTISLNNQVFVGLGYNNGDWNAIDLWQFH